MDCRQSLEEGGSWLPPEKVLAGFLQCARDSERVVLQKRGGRLLWQRVAVAESVLLLAMVPEACGEACSASRIKSPRIHEATQYASLQSRVDLGEGARCTSHWSFVALWH
jgi:hypothetical protein